MLSPEIEKKKPGNAGLFRWDCGMAGHACQPVLLSTDIRCLQPLGAVNDVEAYALTFCQGPETRLLDRGIMGEEISTPVSRGDEAEALGIAEPLYITCWGEGQDGKKKGKKIRRRAGTEPD